MRINQNDANEIASAAAGLIKSQKHMVIATADASGQPWAVPVSQIVLPGVALNWISSVSARHSQNITANGKTSATMWTATLEDGELSLFLEGETKAIEDEAEAQAIIGRRFASPDKPKPPVTEFTGAASYRMYVFTPTAVWMNDDTHTKFVVDLGLLKQALND